MSLATTGGLGGAGSAGGGGLVMGHDAGGGAMANVPSAPQYEQQHSTASGQQSSSIQLPGIEVCDKTQKISLQKAKSIAHLPITAVDLHGAAPTVALYPSQQEAQTQGADLQFLGKMKNSIALQTTETSHKTLRKFLTQAKPYSAMKQDCLVSSNSGSSKDNVVILDKPHLWLGMRRLHQMPKAFKDNYTVDDEETDDSNKESSTSAAISEEAHSGVGCWWTNSTLLGSPPKEWDHDIDRVAAKVRLHSSKKALTILPEEATQMLLHQARSHVATATTKKTKSNNDSNNNDADDFTTFPLSLALPAWAFHDTAMEALYEAAVGVEQDAANATVACMFLRSIAALVGSFTKQQSSSPDAAKNKPTLLSRLGTVHQALLKQHRASNEPDDEFDPSLIVILLGTTPEGVEATAVQVSDPQAGVQHCPFENIQIVANVSKQIAHLQDAPVATLLSACVEELNQVLDMVAPDAAGPSAILTYGSKEEQEQLQSTLSQHLKKQDKTQQHYLQKVPVIAAPVESIANGTALLGGIALGRHGSSGSKKKAQLPLKVSTIATVATGIACFYTPQQARMTSRPKGPPPQMIKTIFDFDRRLPAGPYTLEFKAAECVVQAQRNSSQSSGSSSFSEDDEAFLKAVQEAASAKCIPEREQAALNFHVQVYQKWTRDGEWQPVGNKIAPLVKLDTQIDKDTGEDKEEVKIACEEVGMELSMAITGILATAWIGERESVVQAVKSARGRMFEKYGWWAFAILFFGGFFVKSYWEDYVWKRDTQRLLDYYAHVIPGSIQDGDRDTASWLAYKYRNNKAKLWTNLETKYGVPVPDGDWPEDWVDPVAKKTTPEEEQVDLDTDTANDGDGAEEPVTEEESAEDEQEL